MTWVNTSIVHARHALDAKFRILLQQQIRDEFTATQQCVAAAVDFDDDDLSQLTEFCYRHVGEERQHTMKIVEHFIDGAVAVDLPGADDVRNAFDRPRDALGPALELGGTVTQWVEAPVTVARADNDLLGAQPMRRVLGEQVEEESVVAALVNIAEWAGDNLFDLKEFVARDINS